jgi:FKBP-type peptidyl-prolyl cis-trans isomerase SlyD
MVVEQDRVVSFRYRLSQVGGSLLEESGDQEAPALYLHGHGNLLPAMEKAMAGRSVGDRFELQLSPEEAYGRSDPNRRGRVSLKHLDTGGKRPVPGMRARLNTPQGPMEVRILKVGKFNADVDANHPLADLSLHFAIEICEIREASDAEIAHGHAHGVGGHQH